MTSMIPTLTRPLAAESVKLRRGSLPRLPLFGLLAALLEGVLFLVSPYTVHSWKMLSAWHVLWVTFLSPLALALLAGLAAQQEARARWGGARWRPVTPLALAGAQFAGLAVLALAMDLFVIVGSLPFGLAARLPSPVPLGHGLELALILWVASLPMLAISQLIAARWGLIPTMIAGLIGAVLGVLPAEGAGWALAPWAWPVRATLPLLGVHATGLPLEPHSPVWDLSPWPPVLLALAVAPLLVWLAAHVAVAERDSRRGSQRRRMLAAEAGLGAFQAGGVSLAAPSSAAAPVVAGRYRASALTAEMVKQRRSALPWLAVLGPALIVVAVALPGYPASEALQGWALVVTPFAAALLPARAWLWERDAWRALCARPVSPARLFIAKLAAVWLWGAVSVTLLCLGLGVLGASITVLASFWVLDVSVALLLLALYLLLAVRLGVGVTLGAGAFGTLLALLLGGTELGATIWPFVPWTWAWDAYASGQPLVYAALGLLLGGALALVGAYAAGRRP
jgi:hypothetical protein